MREDSRLRVAINAQISPQDSTGGLVGVLTGLIKALGCLNDGPEEYVVITAEWDPDWIAPYVGANTKIAVRPSYGPEQRNKALATVRRTLRAAKPLITPVLRLLRPSPPPASPFQTARV